MTVNDTIHGFVVEREVPLQELDAVMYQMKHIKTGLELVWISRKEENKVFGISFKTLPWSILFCVDQRIIRLRSHLSSF